MMSIKYLALLLVILTSSSLVYTDDNCSGPFGNFLGCLMIEINRRLETYQQEVSPQIQSSVKDCFSKIACQQPDFSNANIDYFMPEPWASRIKKILDLVEGMEPSVQKCMIENLKEILAKKITDCISEYGSDDIKDFKLPKLPEMKNLDIAKLKQMVLNRMVIWNSTVKCASVNSNDQAIQTLLTCTNDARGKRNGQVCLVRQSCQKQHITTSSGCTSRYESITKALCTCSKEEIRSYRSSPVSRWKTLKDTLFQGSFDGPLKKCYQSNGVTYPEQKVQEAKRAVQEALLDVLKQGSIPAPLMDALNSVSSSLRDITDEWRHSFCSECNADTSFNSESVDVKRVREAAKRQG